MDKSKIPTEKIILGEREIIIYQWLTRDEESTYTTLLMGEKDIPITGEEINLTTSLANFYRANDYLVSVMCLDLSVEDYGVMNPNLRNELTTKLTEIVNKKK